MPDETDLPNVTRQRQAAAITPDEKQRRLKHAQAVADHLAAEAQKAADAKGRVTGKAEEPENTPTAEEIYADAVKAAKTEAKPEPVKPTEPKPEAQKAADAKGQAPATPAPEPPKQ